jgi:UPF0755 protein
MPKFLQKTIWFIILAVLLFWLYSRVVNNKADVDGVSRSSATGRLIERLLGRDSEPEPIVKAEEITIRIPEGWTNEDIAQYLAKTGNWSAADFLAAAKGHEGYLFPDTYRVYASSTPDYIVQKMLDNFAAKVTPDMLADIKKQKKDLADIIIMASLVEKEAAVDNSQSEDRDARIVSGIFWNRLKIGQGLQSDATLSYILKDNNPQHSGADLQINSPYNTYKYRGLPPGPIANPGLTAIRAAIYPLATDYYYFLTTPDKQIYYAKTYDGHLQNKYKYLR